MSHPQNKRERFLVGKRKGIKRAKGMSTSWFDTTEKWFKETSQILRNTTKICNCSMCRNPRHSIWNNDRDKLTMQEKRFDEKSNREFFEI